MHSPQKNLRGRLSLTKRLTSVQHWGAVVQLDSSYAWPASKVRNLPILQILHQSPNIQRRPIDPTILAASMPSTNRRGSTRGSRGVVRVPQQSRGPTQSEVSARFMERLDSWGRADTMPAPTRETTERIESLILMEIFELVFGRREKWLLL